MFYFAKTYSPAECYYYHPDMPLVAIIGALEQWRQKCKRVVYCQQLLTDHTINLDNTIEKTFMNLIHARWFMVLFHFSYEVINSPAKWNTTGGTDREVWISLCSLQCMIKSCSTGSSKIAELSRTIIFVSRPSTRYKLSHIIWSLHRWICHRSSLRKNNQRNSYIWRYERDTGCW